MQLILINDPAKLDGDFRCSKTLRQRRRLDPYDLLFRSKHHCAHQRGHEQLDIVADSRAFYTRGSNLKMVIFGNLFGGRKRNWWAWKTWDCKEFTRPMEVLGAFFKAMESNLFSFQQKLIGIKGGDEAGCSLYELQHSYSRQEGPRTSNGPCSCLMDVDSRAGNPASKHGKGKWIWIASTLMPLKAMQW